MMVKDQLFELIGTLLIGNRIITGGSTLKSESSYEGPDFFCFWGEGGGGVGGLKKIKLLN